MNKKTLAAFDDFLVALDTYARAIEAGKGEKWIGELEESINRLRARMAEEIVS
jgi:hypothetical protein